MRRAALVATGRTVVAIILGTTLLIAPAPHIATQQGIGSSGVTRFVVDRIESPTFEGRAFGEVGQYEKIVGRAFGELDPNDPLNAAIVNLDRAPRNTRGMVEYDVDVYILKPINMERGSGTLLYDVPNRGRKSENINRGAGGGNDPTSASHAGDGFAMERGLTLAWGGWEWEGDLAPGEHLLGARLPIATEPDGAPILRSTHPELGFNALNASVSVSGGEGEFENAAQDQVVRGVGLAAMRDVASFLRYDVSPLLRGDSAVQPAIHFSIGRGGSQAGRPLKDLIYQGFNLDTMGRPVFDGMIPYISGANGNSYEFPFTYETTADVLTGRTDGLLLRCREQGACPKIMHWDSGNEPWQRRSSLVRTLPNGGADAPIPENVRLYYLAGTQHVPRQAPAPGACQQPGNPLEQFDSDRALFVALQQWITDGTEPPPSRYPSLSEGTLVAPTPQSSQGFPEVPGVRYAGTPNSLSVMDYSTLPPQRLPGADYPILVPSVDVDGNEIGGVRVPSLAAPLGTHTGWSLQAAGFGDDVLCGNFGMYIPFAETEAERRVSGDPRLSLEERYGTQQAYVSAIAAAAERLVAERFLLPEDAQLLVEQAERRATGLPDGD